MKITIDTDKQTILNEESGETLPLYSTDCFKHSNQTKKSERLRLNSLMPTELCNTMSAAFRRRWSYLMLYYLKNFITGNDCALLATSIKLNLRLLKLVFADK